MKFRLLLQPAMAAFFAIRSGLADARAGRPPYFWSLIRDGGEREAILKDGWKSVGRVFILAVVLDVVYQLYVLHTIYPMQAFAVAVLLAIVPYVMLRGVATRVARTRLFRRSTPPHLPPVNPMTPANRHP
jgi:hypothetical protein